MTRRHTTLTRLLPLAGLTLAASIACKPWTVRPIDEGRQANAPTPDRFDATAYVESIWETRVIEQARNSAAELLPGRPPGQLPAGPSIFVRGDGTVLRVDTRSRVGLALVDLAPGDGEADVAIQIGPVLRGTALRDALPFVRFGDFANQLAFADVANALNARVLRSVLGGLEPASLDGRRLAFTGATKVAAGADAQLLEIVPVILQPGTK